MDGLGDTSVDRIRARQARVDAKKAASRKTDGAGRGDAGGSRAGTGKAAMRISDGMAHLDATKARTIEAVTAVRLEADMREAARRATEDERVQERLHALQEEAAGSGRANAAVQLKWSDIMERNLPQELAAELNAQRAACSAILASKEALIGGLRAEMRSKDEEYVRALQAQRDDIEMLIARMTEQYAELSASYEAELCGIESALLQERDELLASHKREIDSLFETRRSMETRYVEEKLAREDAYARELADMQAADAENYQKLKVKLETDVAILEQQLEKMKFTYMLNTEKLEYNYRVLTERDNENKATLASQKQRLDRLKAALAKVQSEYDAADARFKAKNVSLTEEYTRITRQYRELQTKFRHFEAADATRYAEVVTMHRDEMTALVDRLVAADRIITEQLLGWTWVPPPSIGYADTDGVPGASLRPHTGVPEATRALESAASVPLTTAGQVAAARAGDVSHALPAAIAAVAPADGETTAASDTSMYAPAQGSVTLEGAMSTADRVDSAKLRGALRLLIVHAAPTVLDASIATACDELERSGKRDVADVIRGDAVLRALGCETDADVSSVVDALELALVRQAASLAPDALEEALQDAGVTPTAGQLGLAVTDSDGMPFLPPGMSVLRVLRNWVQYRRTTMPAVESVGSVAGDASVADTSMDAPAVPGARVGFQATEVVRRIDAALGDGHAGPSAAAAVDAVASSSAVMTGVLGSTVVTADDRSETAYWTRLANTIPPQKVRVWKALERGLGKYKSILSSRSALLRDVSHLAAENDELQRLLAHYLACPAASELQVPPSMTMVLPDTVSATATAAALAPSDARAHTHTHTGTRRTGTSGAPAPTRGTVGTAGQDDGRKTADSAPAPAVRLEVSSRGLYRH